MVKEFMFAIVLTIILFMQFGKGFFSKPPKDEIKIDSILRVFETRLQTSKYQTNSPQPIIITIPSQNEADNSKLTNSLISEFKDLKDDNKRLEAYLKVIATKVYRNVYNDSLSTAIVIDTVSNGILKNQSIQIDYKPRKIKFFEKTITKKLKPKFIFSTGIGITSRLDSLANPQLKGLIGFKNKKGYELQFGISTDRQFDLSLKKDIFVRY